MGNEVLPGQLSESIKNQLVEKWSPVLEHSDANSIALTDKPQKTATAIQLENTEKEMILQGYMHYDAQGNLVENNSVASSLGVFTPIIVPTTRRIAPGLLANQIVGVQPMATPTGYAFAWRSHYAGDGAGGTSSLANSAVEPLHRGESNATKSGPQARSVIVFVPVGTVTGLAVNAAVTDAAGTADYGLVKYFETSDGVQKVLIELTTAGDQPVVGAATISFNAGTTDYAVTGVVTNEIMYNVILKNYAGPQSTAAGEALGTDMKEIATTMERITVTATTRKLKARYTLEMAQDLKSVHGMDAEAELMTMLQYEVTQEIDRDLVAAINDNATNTTTWSYGLQGAPAATSTAGRADGQWELEKLRTLYSRIIKESNLIAKTSRRGPGNFIICSINVVSAIEGLSNFMYAQVAGQVGPVSGGVSRVGTIDGRFAVYVDTHYEGATDYCTIGFKGQGNMDAGVVYCPYIPLMMMKSTNQDTFQPYLGVMTRSAIAYNLNGTNTYYRRFSCDFSNSQFA